MGQPSSSPKRRFRSVDPPESPYSQPRDTSPYDYPYQTRQTNNFAFQPTVSTYITKTTTQVTSPVKSPQTAGSNNPNNVSQKPSAEQLHMRHVTDFNEAVYFTGVFLGIKNTEKSSLQLQGRLELGYNLKTIQGRPNRDPRSAQIHDFFDPFFENFRVVTDNYNVIQRKTPLYKVIDNEHGRASKPRSLQSYQTRDSKEPIQSYDNRGSREPDLNTSMRSIVSIKNKLNNVSIPIEGNIHENTINITLDETILRKLLGKTETERKNGRIGQGGQNQHRDRSEGLRTREDLSIRKDRNERSMGPSNRNSDGAERTNNESFASDATARKSQKGRNSKNQQNHNETRPMPYRDEIYKEFYRDDNSMNNSQVSSARKNRNPFENNNNHPYQNPNSSQQQQQRLPPNQNRFANQVQMAMQSERQGRQVIDQPNRPDQEETPAFQRSPLREGKHMTFNPHQAPPGGYQTERNRPITNNVNNPREDGSKTDRSRNGSFSKTSNHNEPPRRNSPNKPIEGRISPEGAIAMKADNKFKQARDDIKTQKTAAGGPQRNSPPKKNNNYFNNVNTQRGGGGGGQVQPPGKNQMTMVSNSHNNQNPKGPTNKPQNREILRLPTFSEDDMTVSQIPSRSEISNDSDDLEPVKATLDLSNFNSMKQATARPPRKTSPSPIGKQQQPQSQRPDVALLKKLSDPSQSMATSKQKSVSDKNAMKTINGGPKARAVSPQGYQGNRPSSGYGQVRKSPERRIVGEPQDIHREGTGHAREFLQEMFDKLSSNKSDKTISIQSGNNLKNSSFKGKPAERVTDRFGNREVPQQKVTKKSPGLNMLTKHSDELDHYGKKMLMMGTPVKSATPLSGKTTGQVGPPQRTKQSPQRFELNKKGASATARNFA